MILRPTRLSSARRAVRRAFTLMEVLVVVAIIFILASASTLIVFQYLGESKDKMAKAGTKTIEQAASAYYIKNQQWPQSLEELATPADGRPAALAPEALVDPWGNAYLYNPQETHPTTGVPKIYSLGEKPGQSKPISNW
jgi:prepilin-type N-terminal cleavage/methylation domain-containing protein